MEERNIEVNESSSIDKFRRWKVCVLREYCSRRDLPISGKCMVELVALAYSCQEDSIKKWPSCEKESIKKLTLTLAVIPCNIFWLRLPEKYRLLNYNTCIATFVFEIVMRPSTFAKGSDHFCINITYTYLLGLPAIDCPRGENGDGYRAYLCTVIGKSIVKVRLGFGLDIVRVTSSMHDRYG